MPLFMKLQLRFERNRVAVALDFEGAADPLGPIIAAVMYLWTFPRWAESRWCGLGLNARRLMIAKYTGLLSWHAYIMSQKRESKYYIQGLGNLTKPVSRLLAVVACSSRVSEEPLRLMQVDDRIGKTLD